MRAEIVPMEMHTPIDQAWADSKDWHEETNARMVQGFIGVPSRFQGEECRVKVAQLGGLSIIYGIDRKVPDPEDSTHDMVTWLMGNVKLVFTTEEWAMLVAKTDQVIKAGRVSWEAAFGPKEPKSA